MDEDLFRTLAGTFFIVLHRGWDSSCWQIADPFFPPFSSFCRISISSLVCSHLWWQVFSSVGFAVLSCLLLWVKFCRETSAKPVWLPMYAPKSRYLRMFLDTGCINPFPSVVFWGFHGTWTNTYCDAGSLCSNRSFLEVVWQSIFYHFLSLMSIWWVIAAVYNHAEEYNA